MLNFTTVHSTEWIPFPVAHFDKNNINQFLKHHGMKYLKDCAIKYEIHQYDNYGIPKQFFEVSIRMIDVADRVFGFVITNPKNIRTQASLDQDPRNWTEGSIEDWDLKEFMDKIKAAHENDIYLHFKDGLDCPTLRLILK